MRTIVSRVQDQNKLKIFCPCKHEELKHLVDFLHDGEIRCNDKDEFTKVLENLTKIFGFPKDLMCRSQISSPVGNYDMIGVENAVVTNKQTNQPS